MKLALRGKFFAWYVLIAAVVLGSLAVAALNPILTKTGTVQGAVAERIAIDAVCTGNCPPFFTNAGNAGSASFIMTSGTEHFEWFFQIHVGEQAKAAVRVMNDAQVPTVADFQCRPPPGVYFTIAQQTGDGAEIVMRVGNNTFAAFLPGGGFADFVLVVKGLQEGQYTMPCVIYEAWDQQIGLG